MPSDGRAEGESHIDQMRGSLQMKIGSFQNKEIEQREDKQQISTKSASL